MAGRSFVVFYLNGKRLEVRGDDVFVPLANFIRKNLSLPGTKIVCAEGDCGACSVLVAFPEQKSKRTSPFKVINSCIAPVFLFDGASIVSVEGLAAEDGSLSQVQAAMVDCHGSQCGFCTPGFVVTLSSLVEDRKHDGNKIDAQSVKNYCTGNLCRCTGYEPIIQAGLKLEAGGGESIDRRYLHKKIVSDLKKTSKSPFAIQSGDKKCFAPTKAADVTKILKANKKIRIVSAATDLGVLHNKEKIDLYQVITLHHVPELFECKENAKELKVGAKVDLESLRVVCKKHFPAFSEFLNIFASLQIRNFATLVGNVANASPIGDTMPFLFIANAKVEIHGTKKRIIPITEFYKGYKKLDLKPGEWITAVIIPKLSPKARVKIYKVSQRRDMDISSVSAAFFKDATDCRVAYGGVGPTTQRLTRLENFLSDKKLSEENILKAREILRGEITPLSDARASKDFRMLVSENLLRKFAEESP